MKLEESLLCNSLTNYLKLVKGIKIEIEDNELPQLEDILNNTLHVKFCLLLKFSKVSQEKQLIIDFLKEHNLAKIIESNSIYETLNMIYRSIHQLQNPKKIITVLIF